LDALSSFLPEGLSVFAALILVVASFFTSALTAAVGVGGGLLMLALMSYILPIYALIPVHGLVQLGSNVGRSYVQRLYISWPVVRIFLLGSLFGALAGAMFVVQLPENLLRGLLGLFILIVVWIKFPKLANPGSLMIASGGLVTTFVTMFAGATGPLVAVFLNRVFTEHKQMVATHGMTMSVQHALKVAAFTFAGFAFMEWMPLVMIIIASGYAGTRAGSHLLEQLPEAKLKLFFKGVMTLVALDMLRSLFVYSILTFG
jgi:uncharacterized membrane protein YfcA